MVRSTKVFYNGNFNVNIKTNLISSEEEIFGTVVFVLTHVNHIQQILLTAFFQLAVNFNN